MDHKEHLDEPWVAVNVGSRSIRADDIDEGSIVEISRSSTPSSITFHSIHESIPWPTNLPWFQFQDRLLNRVAWWNRLREINIQTTNTDKSAMILKPLDIQEVTTSHSFHQASSQMSRFLPERYEGENTDRLKTLAENDPLKSKKEEIQLFVYQVTNNLIEEDIDYIDDGSEHGRIMGIFRHIDLPLLVWKELFQQCVADESTGMAFIEKLFEAAMNTQTLDICEALLETGVDPDRPIMTGSGDLQRPVQLAVAYWIRNVDLLKLLIRFGADVKLVTDADSEPALHKAANECTLEAVQALVEAGADLKTSITQHTEPARTPHSPLTSAVRAEWRLSHMSAAELAEFIGPREERRGVDILRYLIKFFDKDKDHHIMQDALTQAVSLGRDDMLGILLEAGGNLDEFSPTGYTMLGVAVLSSYKGSRVGVASAILQHGADIHKAFDPSLNNPLRLIHLAAAIDDEDMLELLVKHGANVNERVQLRNKEQLLFLLDIYRYCPLDTYWKEARHCQTPLHFALYQCSSRSTLRSTKTAIFLLQAGAEVSGDELLMAATLGSRSLIQMLLSKNAEVNHVNWTGQSALQLSLSHKHAELVKPLLDAGASLRGGELRHALKVGHEEAIQALLEHGATIQDLNDDDDEASALEEAASGRNYDLMMWLLEEQDVPYDTGALVALLLSSRNSDERYLTKLLEKRPKDLPADIYEGSALAMVLLSGQTYWALPHLFQLPPPDKCILNLTGDAGYWHLCGIRASSILFSPYFWRNPENIECSVFVPMVLAGAWKIIEQLRGWGFRPDRLSVLVAVYHAPLAKFIILTRGLSLDDLSQPAESNLETPLQIALRMKRRDIVRHLLDIGVDVNVPAPQMLEVDEDSQTLILPRTALQAAIEHGDADMIDWLIDAGADVNAPPGEEYGATALQIAAAKGQLGVARRLLELGADINEMGAAYEGRTALEAAAEHGRLDMVHFLLEAGASTTGESFDDAWDFAKKHGHTAVARLLEEWAAGANSRTADLGPESINPTESISAWPMVGI